MSEEHNPHAYCHRDKEFRALEKQLAEAREDYNQLNILHKTTEQYLINANRQSDAAREMARKLAEALKKMEDVDEDDRYESGSYYKSWKLCQRIADEALSLYSKEK